LSLFGLEQWLKMHKVSTVPPPSPTCFWNDAESLTIYDCALCCSQNVYIRPRSRPRSLDLGAGVEQPFDCLIIQNHKAVQSMSRSVGWTLKDNMVDGLFLQHTWSNSTKSSKEIENNNEFELCKEN